MTEWITYLKANSVVLSAVIGLLGVLLATLFKWWIDSRQSKSKRRIEKLDEKIKEALEFTDTFHAAITNLYDGVFALVRALKKEDKDAIKNEVNKVQDTLLETRNLIRIAIQKFASVRSLKDKKLGRLIDEFAKVGNETIG